jgi:hypothetical protein
MAVDLEELIRGGGKGLLDLLSFCVVSVQPEPLFLFLAQEYRLAPMAARALALYDVFCAPGASFRLRCEGPLEPHDLRLARALAPVRAQVARAAVPPPPPPDNEGAALPARAPHVDIPSPFLFDHIVDHLRGLQAGPLQSIPLGYDPTRSPVENLPDGRMTASQRFFVDRVWQPRVRPLLTRAGFWRVQNVG